jgi:hypothetical protein
MPFRQYTLKIGLFLVDTIQAQIFGHHGRGDSAILRGEIIDYRFAEGDIF